MTSTFRRQRGLTLISLVFILGLLGFFILLTFKIVPIYLDHSKVSQALAAVKATPGIQSQSESEIRRSLDKQFNMNYVYDVTQDDIKIVKHGMYLKVEIQYEVVKKLVANLSLLAEFDNEFELGQKE